MEKKKFGESIHERFPQRLDCKRPLKWILVNNLKQSLCCSNNFIFIHLQQVFSRSQHRPMKGVPKWVLCNVPQIQSQA